MAKILRTPFDPERCVAAFTISQLDLGGVASFVGYVRSDNERVLCLNLEHYEGFTDIVLGEIETLAQERFGLNATLIIHRVGLLKPKEPIVLVAAAAAHRKPAIEAVDYMMDRLKTDAPFWKKEISATGEQWIEPRPQDYLSRANWDQQT
jgi:molybdopterin synthase catalytic subunit